MDEQRDLRLIVGLLGVLTAIAIGATLFLLKPVFLPFVLALFGAFAAEPAVKALKRVFVPRPVAAVCVVGLLFVGLHGVGVMVVSSADEIQTEGPKYVLALEGILDQVTVQGEAGSTFLRLDDEAFWLDLLSVQTVVGRVGSVATALTSFAGNLLLVLLLMVALIIGRQRVDERLEAALGEGSAGTNGRGALVFAAIDKGIQRYMLLKTLLSMGVGVLFYGVLAAFGADFAPIWGVLAFVLNYIPTVGPVIATAPPVVLLLLQYSGEPGMAVAAALCTAAVPAIFGNIIEPKVFGDSLNLNFLAVLFALVLWTFLWGVAGAVLSVPIMMAVSLVCKEVPSLRPIHDLLRN